MRNEKNPSNFSARLSHVAFLVPSVERSANGLAAHHFPVGAAEVWDGEGTREIYVGGTGRTGALLLMEPVREGAYSRAMAKRGPGLHHIAVDVLDLEGYLASLSGSGWLLHPKSMESIRLSRTAWLARPGIPTLIEVHGRETIPAGLPFVTEIAFPPIGDLPRLFGALGLDGLFAAAEDAPTLRLEEVSVRFSDILSIVEIPTAEIVGVDHAQISIPPGEEMNARAFYVDFLGLRELEKAAPLRDRGGFWLEVGSIQVHVGAEADVDRFKTKAHLAYRVSGLERWRKRIAERGLIPIDSIPIPGVDRFEFRDPFGNRVEFLERK